eukprot:CAMPEP_0171911998 /NCGR_PEP_ID=MMETSP0993-20121228/10732_1 /TAXON_ID=483369 /ORGANISM="non described non described, Strain CCMP2098" /LENGTH=39 /DNA_ID= /DNA_START= /DNA_END= /DNA_ORIENTATION=
MANKKQEEEVHHGKSILCKQAIRSSSKLACVNETHENAA